MSEREYAGMPMGHCTRDESACMLGFSGRVVAEVLCVSEGYYTIRIAIVSLGKSMENKKKCCI